MAKGTKTPSPKNYAKLGWIWLATIIIEIVAFDLLINTFNNKNSDWIAVIVLYITCAISLILSANYFFRAGKSQKKIYWFIGLITLFLGIASLGYALLGLTL